MSREAAAAVVLALALALVLAFAAALALVALCGCGRAAVEEDAGDCFGEVSDLPANAAYVRAMSPAEPAPESPPEPEREREGGQECETECDTGYDPGCESEPEAECVPEGGDGCEPGGEVAVAPFEGDFQSRGVYADEAGRTFTWYSQRELPGSGLDELNANGRHVDGDGYVRDADGNLAVAVPSALCGEYGIGDAVDTPFGPAVVYDRNPGASWDVYTDW